MNTSQEEQQIALAMATSIVKNSSSRMVYALDKPIGETWTQEEVNHLVNHYMVEVERFPKYPSRVVAMNAPLNEKPIYMTWRPRCSLLTLPYSVRWDNDETYTNTGGIIVRKFDCLPGDLITNAIQRMVDILKGRLGTVEAELNGVLVSVKNGDTAEERWQWMQAEQDRNYQKYINSDKYKEQKKSVF